MQSDEQVGFFDLTTFLLLKPSKPLKKMKYSVNPYMKNTASSNAKMNINKKLCLLQQFVSTSKMTVYFQAPLRR